VQRHTLIQAVFQFRPSSGPCSHAFSGDGSFLAEADGTPGTPVSAGLVRPKPTGHRSRLRRMTPHEAPSASRDAVYVTRLRGDVKQCV